MTIPRAHVAHRAAGRVRLRVPSRRGEPAYFRALGEALSAHRGVLAVEANPLTAGVLVRHAPELPLEALARLGRESALFDLTPSVASHPPAGKLLASRFRDADQALGDLTGGAVDLRSLGFLALVALALLQAARGQILAPATTLLVQAFGLVGAAENGGEGGE
jgi:hypothetical protein